MSKSLTITLKLHYLQAEYRACDLKIEEILYQLNLVQKDLDYKCSLNIAQINLPPDYIKFETGCTI